MVVEATLPTIGAILAAGIIDSVNPCAIGVLILLISTLYVAKGRDKLLSYGFVYIFAVFMTYFLAGLGLTAGLASIPIWIAEYISIFVGALIVFAGLIEIKDFFWYGQGLSLSIPTERAKQIHEMMQKISLKAMIPLGAFVAAVELPCTGGPYLAIILMLSQNFNWQAVELLFLYNLIFILPLIAILLLAHFGMKLSAIKMWKQKNRAVMRLFIGITLVLLGWLLMLIANGTINLG